MWPACTCVDSILFLSSIMIPRLGYTLIVALIRTQEMWWRQSERDGARTAAVGTGDVGAWQEAEGAKHILYRASDELISFETRMHFSFNIHVHRSAHIFPAVKMYRNPSGHISSPSRTERRYMNHFYSELQSNKKHRSVCVSCLPSPQIGE